jgi:hypothetical protein
MAARKRRGRPPKRRTRTIDDLDREEAVEPESGDMEKLFDEVAEQEADAAHDDYEAEQVMRDMGIDPLKGTD